MPVTYSIDEQSTNTKDREVFGQALEKLYGSKLYEDLVQDLDVNIKLKDLGAGTKGDYMRSTGELRVSPGSGRRQNTPEEVLNVILHELTHAAQKKGEDLGLSSVPRNNYLDVNYRVGKVDRDTMLKSLEEANMGYGQNEPAAWLASNMRPGTQSKDPQVQKFIAANPDFSREYYRRNAQPQRPVTTHTKAYPEMTTFEKMMTQMFGTPPSID